MEPSLWRFLCDLSASQQWMSKSIDQFQYSNSPPWWPQRVVENTNVNVRVRFSNVRVDSVSVWPMLVEGNSGGDGSMECMHSCAFRHSSAIMTSSLACLRAWLCLYLESSSAAVACWTSMNPTLIGLRCSTKHPEIAQANNTIASNEFHGTWINGKWACRQGAGRGQCFSCEFGTWNLLSLPLFALVSLFKPQRLLHDLLSNILIRRTDIRKCLSITLFICLTLLTKKSCWESRW